MENIQLTLVYMNKSKKVKGSAAFLEIISNQCRQTDSECKVGIMKNLESMILQQNNSNNSLQASDMSYIQKMSIKDYGRDLIDKINLHQKRSMQLFQIELNKYEIYYRQIADIIHGHYKQGRHKINNEADKVQKFFEDWKKKIQLKSQEFQLKNCHYEDKLKKLQKYTRVQVDLVQIKFPELDFFKKAIQKYRLEFKQTRSDDNKQNVQSFAKCLKKDDKALNISHKEKSKQAPLKSLRQAAPPEVSAVDHEADDLLGCDEQLGAKESPDTIRRRKYDVGRQNVIKEQDESDDTNSIISDS